MTTFFNYVEHMFNAVNYQPPMLIQSTVGIDYVEQSI